MQLELAKCEWMSTPPGITTMPRASSVGAPAGRRSHDAAALDADVPHLAVDAVGRVVDGAARDPEPLRRAHAVLPARRARTAPSSAASVSAAERAPASGGRSGSGTSSMRYAVPPS